MKAISFVRWLPFVAIVAFFGYRYYDTSIAAWREYRRNPPPLEAEKSAVRLIDTFVTKLAPVLHELEEPLPPDHVRTSHYVAWVVGPCREHFGCVPGPYMGPPGAVGAVPECQVSYVGESGHVWIKEVELVRDARLLCIVDPSEAERRTYHEEVRGPMGMTADFMSFRADIWYVDIEAWQIIGTETYEPDPLPERASALVNDDSAGSRVVLDSPEKRAAGSLKEVLERMFVDRCAPHRP